jgi:hypothetical protein
MDTMNLTISPNVSHVTQDVLNVPENQKTVSLVTILEFKIQKNVHVTLDILKFKMSVSHVTISVKLVVLLLLMSVLSVLKTEKLKLVSVQKEPSKLLVKLIVHHVTLNVESVKILLITVPFVLKEESTHQNVPSHHQKLKPLK